MLPEDGYDARKVERIASIFRWLLYSKFRDNREEAIEILLMLVVGHVFGYYTPNTIGPEIGYTQESTVRRIEVLEYLSMETSVDGDGE